jgi:glycosyltransferase involved in cell wall biosynthesis
VYAERGSATSLADKLIDLLDDANRRQQLGRQLRQRAVEQYDWDRAAVKIVDVYHEVLGISTRHYAARRQVTSVDQR